MVRRFLRILTYVILALLAVFAVGSFVVYKSLQSVPDFYTTAIASRVPEPVQAVAELEEEVQELQTELEEVGQWNASFSIDQINTWLATELETKYAKRLPEGVHQPRVAIEEDRLLVACQVESSKLRTVLSLELLPRLTENANELSIRVERIRAGALPISIGRFLKQIEKAALSSKIAMRWEKEDGKNVAVNSTANFSRRHACRRDLRINLNRRQCNNSWWNDQCLRQPASESQRVCGPRVTDR